MTVTSSRAHSRRRAIGRPNADFDRRTSRKKERTTKERDRDRWGKTGECVVAKLQGRHGGVKIVRRETRESFKQVVFDLFVSIGVSGARR